MPLVHGPEHELQTRSLVPLHALLWKVPVVHGVVVHGAHCAGAVALQAESVYSPSAHLVQFLHIASLVALHGDAMYLPAGQLVQSVTGTMVRVKDDVAAIASATIPADTIAQTTSPQTSLLRHSAPTDESIWFSGMPSGGLYAQRLQPHDIMRTSSAHFLAHNTYSCRSYHESPGRRCRTGTKHILRILCGSIAQHISQDAIVRAPMCMICGTPLWSPGRRE